MDLSCNVENCAFCLQSGYTVNPHLTPPHSTDCRADDPVKRPLHYTDGDVEFIDAVRAALGAEGFRAFCRGNALKYVWRSLLKGGDEDLRKAITYLRHAIEDDPR